MNNSSTSSKLTIAMLGAAICAPTVSILPSKFTEEISRGRTVTSAKAKSFIDNLLVANSPTQSLPILDDNVQVRPTTEQEKIVGNIRKWAHLTANWDGEGALPPSKESLRYAAAFISLLTETVELPDPMLNHNGRPGLFWDNDNLYADLEFNNDKIAYYIEKNGDKHKGVVNFSTQKMPAVFATLLADS